MVFVLNKDKRPLAPCHPARARQLLKKGKAVIHRKYPFTIRLKEKKTVDNKQEYRLKIDYGSRTTGMAILRGSDVLWLAELHHRTDIKEKLDTRRMYRRNRRNRKTRYRKSRFLNRTRPQEWLPPSLQSRVDNIGTWVNRLRRLVPLTAISYENVKFDTQLIRNPDISGVEYQQGTLAGYEVREYLLEVWGRKCAYCGTENVPLEVEHIIPKSRGGTDRIDNLTVACHACNQAKGNRTAEEFGYPGIQRGVKPTLKDAALVTVTRWAVYNRLVASGLDVECGTGGRTKKQRTEHGLPKTHYYDAVCVGASTPEQLRFRTREVLSIHAKGRGNRCRTRLDKHGFPRAYLSRQKQHFGFQTGDLVKAVVPKGKYAGTWHGQVAVRKSGYFDLKDRNGKLLAQGILYRYLHPVQRFDGYVYERKEVTPIPPHA